MTFNKLIQQILKENTNKLKIPAFDGEREVYGFGSAFTEIGFHRFSGNYLHLWDAWKNVYKIEDDDGNMVPMANYGYEFTDRNEFLESISQELKQFSEQYPGQGSNWIFDAMNHAVEEMKKNIPSDMPGVYRHFGNTDHGDFWWGFEIDYRYLLTTYVKSSLKDTPELFDAIDLFV